jgi:hypothetical protein
LNPGDIVAEDNFDKLQDGMKIEVRQPTASANQRSAQ